MLTLIGLNVTSLVLYALIYMFHMFNMCNLIGAIIKAAPGREVAGGRGRRPPEPVGRHYYYYYY